MPDLRIAILFALLAMPFFASCGKEAKELRKVAGQLGEIREKLANPPRPEGPPHERVGWKAEDFFTDEKVLALCEAIEAKDLAKIDELIAEGADVNAKGRGNMTPLLWAFPMGEEVFQRILEHGADPNVQLTEDPEVSRQLERAGICPTHSVTYLAAYASGLLLVNFHDINMDNYLRLVLEHGGDVNLETASGRTPLFGAATGVGNSAERVQLLLEAGADINHQDDLETTAAMRATGWHYNNLIVLLEAGADCRIVAGGRGQDVVLLVAKSSRRLKPGLFPDLRRVCDFLEQQGYDLDAARRTLAARAADPRHPCYGLPADQRPWLQPSPPAGSAEREQ